LKRRKDMGRRKGIGGVNRGRESVGGKEKGEGRRVGELRRRGRKRRKEEMG
jgi:hypothetical protein